LPFACASYGHSAYRRRNQFLQSRPTAESSSASCAFPRKRRKIPPTVDLDVNDVTASRARDEDIVLRIGEASQTLTGVFGARTGGWVPDDRHKWSWPIPCQLLLASSRNARSATPTVAEFWLWPFSWAGAIVAEVTPKTKRANKNCRCDAIAHYARLTSLRCRKASLQVAN
jgi:hypothetical protein